MTILDSISNFIINNWVALISNIIAGLALYISWRIYRKQKPILKITVAKCEHSYSKHTNKTKPRDILFWTRFHINNVGDRDTTIDVITLSFKVNEKEYKISEYNEQASVEEVVPIIIKNPSSDRIIIAHRIGDIGAHFDALFDEAEEKQIECKFTVRDTHKEYFVEGISKKVGRFPLQGQPIGRKPK